MLDSAPAGWMARGLLRHTSSKWFPLKHLDSEHSEDGLIGPAHPPETHHEVCDALLNAERIDALIASDGNIIVWERESWQVVVDPRGRNADLIIWPWLAVTMWAVLIAVLIGPRDGGGLDLTERGQATPIFEMIIRTIDELFVHVLGTVSFLLVFRLSRAAVRYWDARAALGKLVELCRAFASEACVFCAHAPAERNAMLRWLGVVPVATKNYLRPSLNELKRAYELIPLLSAKEANELLEAPCQPITALNRLRELIGAVARAPTPPGHEHLGPMVYHRLNELVQGLTGCFGAMERINLTPLPFVYVAHLRTFLVMYLMLGPLPVLYDRGLPALLSVCLMTWGMLGIEAAAVECERPFFRRRSHLTLGRACLVVAQSLVQTAKDLPLPTPGLVGRAPAPRPRGAHGTPAPPVPAGSADRRVHFR